MESLKKGNKLLLVFSIIAFALSVTFVVLLIKNVGIKIPEDPPMSDPNWFDISSENMKLQSTKTFKTIGCIFGTVVTLIVGTVLMLAYFRVPQKMMESSAKGISSFVNTIKETIKPTPEKICCQYCGSLIEPDVDKCSGCGSKRKKH